MSSQRSFSRPISPAHQPPTPASSSSSGTSTSPAASGISGLTSTNTVSSPGSQGPHSVVHRPQNTNSITPPVEPPADWYPFTLRWYFLVVPIFLSLLFGISSICLHFYSRQHDGLGRDDNSSMVLFAWRFLPTLIAVLYTQLTVIIFEDVKRTEPFARLAKSPSAGATAYGTLLQTPKSWWAISYDIIFKRKLMGKTGWSLIAALMVHVLALIAISPLSSALLATEEVIVAKPFDFTRSSPAEGVQIPMSITRESYFRIIASLSRNMSTSAWATDDSFTFPVWPSSGRQQVGPTISSEQNSWQIEATTYSMAYTCQNMTLEKTELRNFTYSQADWHSLEYGKELTGEGPMVVYTLNSEVGCRYELKLHPSVDLAYNGGITWSDASTYNYDRGASFVFDGRRFDANLTDRSPFARVNSSKECKGRDIIIASTPWTTPVLSFKVQGMSPDQTKFRQSPDFKLRALLCSSTYASRTGTIEMKMALGEQTVMEHMPGTVTHNSSLSNTELGLDDFQTISTGFHWPNYFGSAERDMLVPFVPPDLENLDSDMAGIHTVVAGPGIALGASWRYNISRMIEATELVETARRIKGRMFAEILRDSLPRSEFFKQEMVKGTVSVLEERIVVLPEISIAICVLFLISFFLLLSLLWTSRIHRRPLQLHSDPGSTVGLGALIHPQRTHLATLKKMHSAPRQEISKILRSETFRTSGGTLYQGSAVSSSGTPSSNSGKKRDWRPRVIRLKSLFALCGFLLLITAAIVVLYTFSTSSKLYQKVFTYDTDLSKFGLSISSFAPISIAPAVISIVITLWWDQIDATFRLLQPYIAMSQKSTPIRSGAGLTYRSKTWFGAAVKAARHRHWILFMVAIGSTLCQILTVSMSALFERQMDSASHQISLNKTLQIRQYPLVSEASSMYGVMSDMFTNPSSNWLYTALARLSLDGPQLAWTKDEWSFVPLDLLPTIDTSQQPVTSDNSSPASTASNITISTPAIRIRIECDTIPAIQNTSSWVGPKESENFWESEETIQNVTGLQNFTALRPNIFEGTPAVTTILNDDFQVQCCKNGTGKRSKPAAIGRWSPVNATEGYYEDRSWPLSFVPKWILGEPILAKTHPVVPYQMIFEENPEIQAALCKPVIETTEATVLVDQVTGSVHSYNLESPPMEYDSAWSEVFLRRSRSGTTVHYNSTTDDRPMDITTSFGVLFLDTLLSAANQDYIGDDGYENVAENYFNFRDMANGLNLDLMTYAMYTMADKDPRALLNYTTLTTYANRTAQTFFQHFVSSPQNFTRSGFAYQEIDDNSMSTIGHAIDENGTAIGQPVYPAFNVGRNSLATVTDRIQVLRLNPAATFLSIGILLWLVGTAAVVSCVQRRYTRTMLRNVELIADALVLVAGSENFLNLVQERGVALKRDENIRTKLGWFKGRDGEVRWGVEVVGGRNAVEWVEPPKQGII